MVFFCSKENVTQEMVCFFWNDLRWSNKKEATEKLSAYLWRFAAPASKEEFARTVRGFHHLAEMWSFPAVMEMVEAFFMEYMHSTFYRSQGGSSLARLEDFVEKNPFLAEYIWQTTFSTENERRALSAKLGVSKRNEAGFVKSQHFGDLRRFVETKRGVLRSFARDHYDLLPKAIQKRIAQAQKDLEDASDRNALSRYIDSEKVAIAREQVRLAWIDADRYIGKQAFLKSRRSYVITEQRGTRT